MTNVNLMLLNGSKSYPKEQHKTSLWLNGCTPICLSTKTNGNQIYVNFVPCHPAALAEGTIIVTCVALTHLILRADERFSEIHGTHGTHSKPFEDNHCHSSLKCRADMQHVLDGFASTGELLSVSVSGPRMSRNETGMLL